MNDQDGLDYSKWQSFFKEETVFVSNAVLDQMIEDIKTERASRPCTKENESE